jgi:hypothetical protein
VCWHKTSSVCLPRWSTSLSLSDILAPPPFCADPLGATRVHSSQTHTIPHSISASFFSPLTRSQTFGYTKRRAAQSKSSQQLPRCCRRCCCCCCCCRLGNTPISISPPHPPNRHLHLKRNPPDSFQSRNPPPTHLFHPPPPLSTSFSLTTRTISLPPTPGVVVVRSLYNWWRVCACVSVCALVCVCVFLFPAPQHLRPSLRSNTLDIPSAATDQETSPEPSCCCCGGVSVCLCVLACVSCTDPYSLVRQCVGQCLSVSNDGNLCPVKRF